LQTLDVLVAGSVEEAPRSTPPSAPALGNCYIVADAATDHWAGKSRHVAAWTSGGWRYIPPVEGMTVHERTSGASAVFAGGAWEVGILRGASLAIGGQQVVGTRAAAIQSPTGGTVIDAEARATLDAILDMLRQHGLIDS
jgi:uncharacterized protein DUF2793